MNDPKHPTIRYTLTFAGTLYMLSVPTLQYFVFRHEESIDVRAAFGFYSAPAITVALVLLLALSGHWAWQVWNSLTQKQTAAALTAKKEG